MSIIKSYAVKEVGGELEAYEYDPDELKPQDAGVQMDYCGTCHSDLSMIGSEWGFLQYPLVAGYGVIGRVAALGSAAQNRGLQVGQRVGIGWTARNCGRCDTCIGGNRINYEQDAVSMVINRDDFAEKLRTDRQWVVPLPEGINIEPARPLLCGGITVFELLLIHRTTVTSRVGVIDTSGLEHIAIELLHAMGYEVTAFNFNPAKEQEVLAMGADKVANSCGPQALKALAEQLDLTINIVNVSLDWQSYFEVLTCGSSFYAVDVVPTSLLVPAFTLIADDRSISGSATGTPHELCKLMRFAAHSKVASTTGLFPMPKINDTIQHVRDGKARYRVVLKAGF